MLFEHKTITDFKVEIEENLHSEIDLGIFEMHENLQNDPIKEENFISKKKSTHLLKSRNTKLRKKVKVVSNYGLRSKNAVKGIFNRQRNVLNKIHIEGLTSRRYRNKKIKEAEDKTKYKIKIRNIQNDSMISYVKKQTKYRKKIKQIYSGQTGTLHQHLSDIQTLNLKTKKYLINALIREKKEQLNQHSHNYEDQLTYDSTN